MAYLNRMAKFLSQALEWKARFPNAQFYGGLRFEPFIYAKARKIFPNYHKLYPDDKDFIQRFVRDLRNKDATLLKIINPDQLGPDLETASIQFETEARLEQQAVAQTNPQEVPQPFSLSSPSIPRVPLSAGLARAAPEEKSTMVSQAEQHQTPPPVSKPRFQLPKIPSGISSFGKDLGVNSGIALKTGAGRVTSGLSSIFGGLARGGGGVLVKAGGFGADAMVRFSNQISRGGLITGPSKRVWIGAVLGFLILFFILGSIGGLPTSTPTGEAAPIPGNVGIGNTAPKVSNIPLPEGDLREALINNFGITMNGFSQQHLRWAWEKLQSITQTNFTALTRGTTITAISGSISSQTGCKTVNLGTYNDQTVFKVTLTHELGHIIYWCNPNPLNQKSEHQDVFRQEGGITGYATSPCYGSSGLTEDYAEMAAYYLNPNTVETTPCNNRGVVPFANGKYPLHYNLAKSILGNY